MSQPSGSAPCWIPDPRARSYYYYNEAADTLVYQNGSTIPRPPQVPRSWYRQYAAAHAVLPVTNIAFSPTGSQSHCSHAALQSPSGDPPGRYHHASPGSSPGPWTGQTPQLPMASITAGVAAMGTSSGHTRAASATNAQPAQEQVQQFVHVDQITGVKAVSTTRRDTYVKTIIATEPAGRITDPALRNQGITAHRMLIGSGVEGDEEKLYSTFKTKPKKFFDVGRVFMVLWTEPAGENATQVTYRERSDRQALSEVRFGEYVYSKVRRFVVIRKSDTYCSALPVVTYGNRGVGKPGVIKSEHSIVHTSVPAPTATPQEKARRGEQPMRSRSIKVMPDEPSYKLDPMSRLDYGKVHTIQHNIKVKALGNVHPKSLEALQSQFKNVWAQKIAAAGRSDDSEASGSGLDEAGSSNAPPKATFSHAAQSSSSVVTPQQQAQQTINVRNQYRQLVSQGHDQTKALQIMVQRLVQPGYTEAAAKSWLRAQLSNADTSSATAGESRDCNIADSDDEDRDEDSSDDNSGDDDDG